MLSIPRLSLSLVVVVVAAAAACGREPEGSPTDRGAGLAAVELPPSEQAGAYAAALRGAFDLGPGLVLLVNPALLPRGRDEEVADTLAPEVVEALNASRVVQGSCTPSEAVETMAPICPGANAGYVVRFSELFGVGGDTVQLYVTFDSYRPSQDTSAYQAPIRLEQRYELAKRGPAWVVARKERLAK